MTATDTLRAQDLRQKRLLEIIDKGLPPFRHSALELTTVLSGASPDVKKAAKLIRTDAALSAQLLRMCSSPVFGIRSRVVSIDQAAILLGADRLRSLVLTSSMVDLASNGLPREQSTRFWEHSFLSAMLSEHLAKRTGYAEPEQAYIAGLLHDIGQVPQWMLLYEEKSKTKAPPPEDWFDNPSFERDYFGLDHSQLGGSMATSWNFMPSFIDVLKSHHQPAEAEHDPYLVQIVGAIEHFLLTRVDENIGDPETPQAPAAAPTSEIENSQLAPRTSHAYDDSDWQGIAENLEIEYNRLVPLVAGGLTNVISRAK